MVRISNGIITLLNILTLVVGVASIGYAFWFHVKAESACEKVLKMPLLVVGTALLVVSLTGLVGSCCRVSFFMYLYLFALLVLILGLIVFTLFAIVITNKSVGKALSDKGVGSMKTADFSAWLRNKVGSPENWDKFQSCMVDGRLCSRIEGGHDQEFYKHSLVNIQWACCQPPENCGFKFQNATYWLVPEVGPEASDPDCKTWSNDQRQLCFGCESCKVTILDQIQREWKLLAIINACFLAVVLIVYCIGCCALGNNRRYGYGKHRVAYYG